MEKSFLPVKLAGDILEKRSNDDLTFRELSELIGIDKMKLYRMESADKSVPGLEDFFTVCHWLGNSMETYFIKPKNKTNGHSTKATTGKQVSGNRKGKK